MSSCETDAGFSLDKLTVSSPLPGSWTLKPSLFWAKTSYGPSNGAGSRPFLTNTCNAVDKSSETWKLIDQVRLCLCCTPCWKGRRQCLAWLLCARPTLSLEVSNPNCFFCLGWERLSFLSNACVVFWPCCLTRDDRPSLLGAWYLKFAWVGSKSWK